MDNKMNSSLTKIFQMKEFTVTLCKPAITTCRIPNTSTVWIENFSTVGERECTWELLLRIGRQPIKTIEFYLRPSLFSHTELFAKCSFSLKSWNNELVFESEHEETFCSKDYYRRLGRPWCVNLNELPVGCDDYFKVSVVALVEVFSLQSRKINTQNGKKSPDMFQDFEAMLKNGEFNDFIFKLEDDDKFPVSRTVAATKCSYFFAMFKQNVSEILLEHRETEDSDKGTAFNLLKFIYGRETCLTKEDAKKLLPAANKHRIPDLKRVCVKILSQNLCVSDVPDILIIAELSNCLDLKRTAFRYIAHNPSKFLVFPAPNKVKGPQLIIRIGE